MKIKKASDSVQDLDVQESFFFFFLLIEGYVQLFDVVCQSQLCTIWVSVCLFVCWTSNVCKTGLRI